jgi:hypothetical protein
MCVVALFVLAGCNHKVSSTTAGVSVVPRSTESPMLSQQIQSGRPSLSGSGSTSPTGSQVPKAVGGESGGAAAPSPVGAADKPPPPVTVAPTKTIAFINLPKGFSGTKYGAVFEPYGSTLGMGSASRPQIVVRIDSWEAVGHVVSGIPNLTKHNAMVTLSPSVDAKTIAQGGRYEATVSILPQGGLGVLVVEKAKRLR